MVNEKYYKGFEGEKEVAVYNDLKSGFEIWEGYFETLMSGCDLTNLKEGGLLYSYVTRNGFYEEETWKIPNLELVLREIESFEPNIAEIESAEMIVEIENLKKDLICFINETRDKGLSIYVQYD